MRTRPRHLVPGSVRRDPMAVVVVLGVLVVAIVLGAGLVRADDRRAGIDIEVGDDADTTFVRSTRDAPFRMPLRGADGRLAASSNDVLAPGSAPRSAQAAPSSSVAAPRRPARRPMPSAGRPAARQPSRPRPRPVTRPAAPAPPAAVPPRPPAPAPDAARPTSPKPEPPARPDRPARPEPPAKPAPVGGGTDPAPPAALPEVARPNAGGDVTRPAEDVLAPALGVARSPLR